MEFTQTIWWNNICMFGLGFWYGAFVIYLFIRHLINDENVFVYEPYSSEEEYQYELNWFTSSPLSDNEFTDREKRIVIALAKRTGKEDAISFKWVEK